MMDREAYLAGYLAEVEEHLASAGKNLLAAEEGLARGERQPRAVRALFRSLHTVKGLSAMVGVDPAVDIAHGMETLLREAEAAGGALTPHMPDLLAKGLRALEACVAALAKGAEVPPAPPALIAALGAAAGGAARSPSPATATMPPELAAKLTASETEQIAQGLAAGKSAVQVEFSPAANRQAEGLSITKIREKLTEISEIIRVFPFSVPPSEAAPAGLRFVLLILTDRAPAAVAAAAGLAEGAAQLLASPAPPPPPSELADAEDDDVSAHGGRVVRVPVARLDDALERLSALVVTRSRLGRAVADLANRGADVRELQLIVTESSRQLRDLRAAIMRARMVSVSELLERVPLMVRGLTRATGKVVHLEIDAGQAELDKSVGERVFPAIVHLVRNAVDHALELPEERKRRGKPTEGVVRVECHERGQSQLELTVSDDGRGVDREAVARRAGRPVPASDEELLDLLALPGVSTAERATATSGRGMGVDIVRRIVRDLGGDLELQTTPGRGSRFTIRVPLSITIVDAFAFQAAGQSFVTPVAAVEEILDVDRARLTPAPGNGGLDVGLIQRRGTAIPVVHLDAAFGLPPTAASTNGLPPKALVVRRGGLPVAFIVDRMLGQQEVVVRPVEDALVRVVGVTGSTDLGDGRPTLVIDLAALSARLDEARAARGGGRA